jgi:hypothetical protein
LEEAETLGQEAAEVATVLFTHEIELVLGTQQLFQQMEPHKKI